MSLPATPITRTKPSIVLSSFMALLFSIITFSITILSSSSAFADDDNSIVDEIDITVPVSCSLSGTGMDTHITELHNTESDSSIGESTITAYCNDLNGFSIYAVGFTNNEYGNNYLIDSNLPSTTNIATGTATSGNTSQWAMKLSPITNTNPAPTYPIIITGTTEDTDKTPTTLNYTSFQPVPNEYALVAKRKAATDVGTSAEGSSFKTTYQAYVSPTQNAGIYTGQVRYTLVHPYNHAVPDPPSFKVLYTGRPISTEPGNENPVTVLMSDLPQDGKYNLLGTTSGQYDKLTPNTLYGGYYKFYGDFDDFDKFLETYEVYDGKNMIIRDLGRFQTVDGADMEPEEGDVVLVKEVPADVYLIPYWRTSYSGGRIVAMQFFTDSDDWYYNEVDFEFTQNNEDTKRKTKNARAWTLTLANGNQYRITAEIVHPSASAADNIIWYWVDEDNDYLNENADLNFTLYWVTPDNYKVSSKFRLEGELNDLQYANLSSNKVTVPITITRWQNADSP